MNKQTGSDEVAVQYSASTPDTCACHENMAFTDLAAALAEIRKLKGVSGYILRGSDSAVIDLVEQDKVVPYAVLSSQLYQSCHEMAKQLGLGKVESALLEGKHVKILCIRIGENSVSIFMDKSAVHAWILKRLLI